MHSFRQHGQDTKEEVASRDLRMELESKERETKEKKEGKSRSFTGKDQFKCYKKGVVCCTNYVKLAMNLMPVKLSEQIDDLLSTNQVL